MHTNFCAGGECSFCDDGHKKGCDCKTCQRSMCCGSMGCKSWAKLLLRLSLAAVFLYHGVFHITHMTSLVTLMQTTGFPGWLAYMSAWLEVLAAIAMLLGLFVRFAGYVLTLIMAGAILLKIFAWHIPFSAMDTLGWEFDLVLLCVSLSLSWLGGGRITAGYWHGCCKDERKKHDDEKSEGRHIA